MLLSLGGICSFFLLSASSFLDILFNSGTGSHQAPIPILLLLHDLAVHVRVAFLLLNGLPILNGLLLRHLLRGIHVESFVRGCRAWRADFLLSFWVSGYHDEALGGVRGGLPLGRLMRRWFWHLRAVRNGYAIKDGLVGMAGRCAKEMFDARDERNACWLRPGGFHMCHDSYTHLALLEPYNEHRYDVYTLAPRRLRPYLLSEPARETLASIIPKGYDRAGVLAILNDPNIPVADLPINQQNAQGDIACVYHIGYKFLSASPKGYVGRTNQNKRRQIAHTRDTDQARKGDAVLLQRSHYRHAKDASSKTVTVVCLLEHIYPSDTQALGVSVDDSVQDPYLWEERRLADVVKLESNEK